MVLSVLRIIKFALQDFWRNFWLSLVTITVLVLALFSVNILIALNAVSDTVISSVEEKVDINILVEKDATDAEIENFSNFLLNIEEIENVTSKTKDEVLENFQQENIDDPEMQEALDELEENPFNHTFIIKAKKTSDYTAIINTIMESDYEKLVENKDFADPQKIIAFVQTMTGKAEKFGLILTGIFAAIALLIVFNTIRITIYTHKEEIGVMRLVGATNWFIRTPYLLEGMLFAFLAVVLVALGLYGLLYLAQPYLYSFFQYYNFNLIDYFNQNFIQIFGLELIAAIFLTVISSGFAISKYLKV